MEDSDNEEILSLGKKVFPYKGLPNTIRLFGQFTAIDRNGRDISYLFTENLTKLFCLLVEYHKKDGISSKLLGHMMWPDKDEKKIKNSKGVAVMQLRGALALMNGIDIVFDSGNYVLKVTPELHCDYLDALGLSEDRDLTGIASQGPFLSFMTDPLFDDFKSETEEFLAEALLGEMEHRSSEKDWREVIRTSNSLFMQDPLNETGFSLLMTALVELGLIKEATIRYQRFTEEYMKTMGTKFAVPLKKYLQQKNRDSKR